MAGRVVPYTYPVHLTGDDEPEHHTAHVMTVLHPAEVARSPEKIRILQSNLGRFAYLLTGANFDLEEKGSTTGPATPWRTPRSGSPRSTPTWPAGGRRTS
jgi:hypothetical protein